MRLTALAATGAAAALLATGCASTAPAARVHSEVSTLGYPAHTVFQSRAAILAAKDFCHALQSGTTYRQAVAAAEPQFNGFNARAAAVAFINTAISAYCPDVPR